MAVWPAAPLLLSPSTRARSWVASRNELSPRGPARLLSSGVATHTLGSVASGDNRKAVPSDVAPVQPRPRPQEGAGSAGGRHRIPSQAAGPTSGSRGSRPRPTSRACTKLSRGRGPGLQEAAWTPGPPTPGVRSGGPRAKASPAVPRFGNPGPQSSPSGTSPGTRPRVTRAVPAAAPRGAASYGEEGDVGPPAIRSEEGTPTRPTSAPVRGCKSLRVSRRPGPPAPAPGGPTMRDSRGGRGGRSPGTPSPSGASRGSLPHAPSRPVREDGRGPRLQDKKALCSRAHKSARHPLPCRPFAPIEGNRRDFPGASKLGA